MKKLSTTIAVALSVLALASCGKAIETGGTKVAPKATPVSASTPASSPSTSDSNFPTPDPADLTPTEEKSSTSEGKFGSMGSFTIDDEPFDVTVKAAVKAKCKYASAGMNCSKPETGDRFVNVPIVVKNNGKSALEMNPGMFALEFADGTRVDSSDGNTYEYGPDNVLDYGQKVRVGGTLKTSLTFEAPKGAFRIVLLSDSFGNGDDLYIWK
jgi:hypothetical protein